MIKKIKYYFIIWWIPLVTYFIIIFIFFVGCGLRRDWIISVFVILFLLNILLTLISSIVQIRIKRWYLLIPQTGLTLLLSSYFLTIFMFSPPDYYGVYKEIPKGIEIYKPIDYEPKTTDFDEGNLIIASCSQPGIYCFYSNYRPTELAIFILKLLKLLPMINYQKSVSKNDRN